MNFAEISSMVTLGLNIFAVITLVFAFLMGLKRGVFKSAVRTVSLFLSAIVAMVLVNVFLPTILETLANTLLDSFGGDGIVGDLLMAKTTLTVFEALLAAILAPIIFVFVYFIVNKLFLIVCAIVNGIFKRHYQEIEKKIPCRRLFGGLIAMVGACVTLVVIATPIGGYAELVDNVMARAEEVMDEDDDAKDAKDVKGIKDDKNDKDDKDDESVLGEFEDVGLFADAIAIKVPYSIGGKLFFESLTTLRIEEGGVIDKEVNTTIEHELLGILELIPLAENFENMSFETIEGMNIDPLRDVANALSDEDSSEIVRIMVADIFATASTKWLAGDTYLSIDLMGMLEGDAAMFRGPVESILRGLADTHVSTVGADVLTLVNKFDDIGNFFLGLSDLAGKIGDGHDVTVDDVMNVLENLTPEVAEAISVSLPSVIEKVGVDGAPEQASKLMVNVLSDALVGIADMNANETDRAEVEKEADAIRTVLTVAMNPNPEMTEDEADDLINTVMDSTVLAGSIQTTVEELENAGETNDMDLSDADKLTVKNKLDAYAEENEIDETQKATLDALHSFFGTNTIVE